jgi:glycolate oxidase FAD binding subunit
VHAPSGIESIQPDEMIVSCGAGTPIAELNEALATVGQCVALPPSGTVGGALSVGHSDVRRLGYGPVRDALLQTHYVSAGGDVVKAGGPTVKNVSGFDLCRLLVGSRGTLGFLGAVILRTRPLPPLSQWFSTPFDPWVTLANLYRPVSVLWDGDTTWVLLEGHADDVREQAAAASLRETGGPPSLPTAHRWSVPPAQIRTLLGTSGFVAEVGVGVVHHCSPRDRPSSQSGVIGLHARLKAQFDPENRLNPGLDLLDV